MADHRIRQEILRKSCHILLLAYPAGYRFQRGAEILSTVLDTTGAGRMLPRIADAADVVAHGVRLRLRTLHAAGLDGGLRTAAPIALALAGGIALFAWWRVEPVGVTDLGAGGSGGQTTGWLLGFGPFRTLGPIAYGMWILAALAHTRPSPTMSRRLATAGVGLTASVPALSVAGGLDRPPLWVLTALAAFGVIYLAGTSAAAATHSASTVEERLTVPLGALAVGLSAGTVGEVWPPLIQDYQHYYQPSVARVGVIASATVAVMVTIALRRQRRSGSRRDWLWATALLALPVGWLGPFDTAHIRIAIDPSIPRFGRLAHIVLASWLAGYAIARLARPDSGSASRRALTRRRLGFAGANAVGAAIGIAAFVVASRAGLTGFASTSLVLPPMAAGTWVVLLASGLGAIAVGRWPPAAASPTAPGWPMRTTAAQTAGAAAIFLLASWLVAAYDNGWDWAGWPDMARTLSVICVLALAPLAATAAVAFVLLAGAREFAGRWFPRAFGVLLLAASGGWLAYLTLPFALWWGPALLVLIASGVILALPRRATA